MLTKQDRKSQHRAIERVRKIRIENVRRLCDMYGSWAEVARRSGHSSSFLVQIAGPNPRRAIGEDFARSFEEKMALPSGWLDMAR